MLGDIRYNEWGQVVGAGALEVDNDNLFKEKNVSNDYL